MRKLFYSLAFYSLAALGIYFAYFYLTKDNNLFAILFFCAAMILLAIGFVFMFLFLNRNNAAKMESLQNRLKLWTDISYHVSQAGDEVFNKLPVGVLIYDDSYEIKWANEYSKKIFDNSYKRIMLFFRNIFPGQAGRTIGSWL